MSRHDTKRGTYGTETISYENYFVMETLFTTELEEIDGGKCGKRFT